jgi:hypothetical protein
MSEVLEKRYAINKVRHAVSNDSAAPFGYLLAKIEAFADIRNKKRIKPFEGVRQKYFFFEGVTKVRYYIPHDPIGKRGRPSQVKFEGELIITDEELLMTSPEYSNLCEDERASYETYLALKAQFEK